MHISDAEITLLKVKSAKQCLLGIIWHYLLGMLQDQWPTLEHNLSLQCFLYNYIGQIHNFTFKYMLPMFQNYLVFISSFSKKVTVVSHNPNNYFEEAALPQSLKVTWGQENRIFKVESDPENQWHVVNRENIKGTSNLVKVCLWVPSTNCSPLFPFHFYMFS